MVGAAQDGGEALGETMVRKQGDWLAATVGDELVMMSPAAGLYLGLTSVGARIWELIETPAPLDEVCERLLQEYDVTPEACRAEVETFLKDLAKHGAVELDPAPAD